MDNVKAVRDYVESVMVLPVVARNCSATLLRSRVKRNLSQEFLNETRK